MKFILTVLSSEQRVTKLHCLKIDTHLTFQTTLTHPHQHFPGLYHHMEEWISFLRDMMSTRYSGHEKLEDISKFRDLK